MERLKNEHIPSPVLNSAESLLKNRAYVFSALNRLIEHCGADEGDVSFPAARSPFNIHELTEMISVAFLSEIHPKNSS